jgi:beta-galactosidase/beta-glucuronidase
MAKERIMMTRVFAFAALLFLTGPAFAQWRMAEKSIVSRWAKEVTPENVWQEYPRPQLRRAEWENLNGLWEYALLPKGTPMPTEYQGQILVPFCIESALSGVGKSMRPEDRLWYRRSFEVPGSWRNRRVILNFEAVDWAAAVWVNGAFVGSHKGAYDRFSFDITTYLSSSNPQTLVVAVDDPSSFGTQARGKQQFPQRGIWYTPVSGIWQTVWLESIPRQAGIKEVKILPDLDRGTVTVVPMLFQPTHQEYEVTISVLDGGKRVAQARARADSAITVSINNPKLWSPNSPFLYDLELQLEGPDGPVEELQSYFGMRKISLGKGSLGNKVFHLNNKPLFHYGTLDQGWWPDGLHTPPSDEAMKYDIQVTKEMGFNMIRKHIKVEPDRWYYWCDKLGMMVWQDMPSGMAIVPREGDERPYHVQHVPRQGIDLQRRSEDSAQFEWELRRMMDLRRNAPSIVIWVPFNEGWGQYDTCRITEEVKGYDPRRLVIATSGWALRPCGDVHDIHSYAIQVRVPEMFEERASVVGEYGGIGFPVTGHQWNPEMRNWGYQTYHSAEELLENYIVKFEQIVEMKNKGLSGAVYTQTTDVEGEVNGLLTYDREVIKIDPEKLRELHSQLYD